MAIKIIGNCANCGKRIERKTTKMKFKNIFCSKECSKMYRIKILKKNAYYSNRKLSFAGVEIKKEHIISTYEYFVYKYYFKLLYQRRKEERISDAYYCFSKMLEEENTNDLYAFYRAIRNFAYREKQKMFYEVQVNDD